MDEGRDSVCDVSNDAAESRFGDGLSRFMGRKCLTGWPTCEAQREEENPLVEVPRKLFQCSTE